MIQELLIHAHLVRFVEPLTGKILPAIVVKFDAETNKAHLLVITDNVNNDPAFVRKTEVSYDITRRPGTFHCVELKGLWKTIKQFLVNYTPNWFLNLFSKRK